MNGLERIQLDLSKPMTDEPFFVAGHHVYCVDAPRSGDYIYVKFNDRAAPAWPMQRGLGWNLPFEQVFITIPSGQSGSMVLMVGADAPETHLPIDNRTAAADLLSEQLTALQAINSKL